MTLRPHYTHTPTPRGRKAREAETEAARAARWMRGWGLEVHPDSGAAIEPWTEDMWLPSQAYRLRYIDCAAGSGALEAA